MYKTIFSLVFSTCLLLLSCQQKQAPPAPPVSVNLFKVKSVPVTYFDKYTATTVALSQVNLLPQVQGYVTAIYFREGSHVKKGQNLYEIDRRIYQGNVQAAEATLKMAEGNMTQAQQDADRYSYLNSEKAVAKQLYDHAIIALENSKNAYRSAAESLKNAKTNLTYSVITAPFDGTIGFSQVKLGDLMNVGQTVMNTISSDDPMAVDFLINEKQLPHFEKIESGAYNAVDSLFTLQMPDNTFYPFAGRISVIDRAVNSQTGSIRVRLIFPNSKYLLRPGMSCVLNVRNQETTPQMLIPNKAIIEQMGEFFVYVAKDTSITKADSAGKYQKSETYQGLIAMQKKVKTGETIGPDIVIKGGISDGDRIVVDGVQSLHDGSRISTSSKPPAVDKQGNGKP